MEKIHIINYNINLDIFTIPIGINEFDHKFFVYNKIGDNYYVQIEILHHLPSYFHIKEIKDFTDHLMGKLTGRYYIIQEINGESKECFEILPNNVGGSLDSNTIFYSMSEYSNLSILKLKVKDSGTASIANIEKLCLANYRNKQIDSILED